MIIDAHQHFWRPARGDYGWLTPAIPTLHRDFMPADLASLLRRESIDGTVLVQAAPTVAETRFLLGLAREADFVRGVVGWVDFADPAAPDTIAALAEDPALVGLRPMIQDIADDGWMLREDLAPAFAAMVAHGLVFDALVLPRHLTRLSRLMARHPDLRVVIDHGAKPEIAAGRFDTWARDMAALARDTPAWCKLSGLLTEAGDGWTPERVAPYVDHLLDCFGPGRLVWGSDWPVLTLAAEYGEWHRLARALIPDPAMHGAIFGANACTLYGLQPVGEGGAE